MFIRITKKLRLKVARPFWIEIAKQPQLELRLPKGVENVNIPIAPPGYILRTFEHSDRIGLLSLFARVGFVFSENQLEEILSFCLPQGCFVIEHLESKILAATMMARHLSSPEYPFGGRIDWLATDPVHQGKGLGNICARSATAHLIELGYKNIWVTSDIERIGALKIFLSIGFEPVIIAESLERWKLVYDTLNIPRNF